MTEAEKDLVEIEEERISLRGLMRAISRIQSGIMEIDHRWIEESDDEVWRATKERGSPNDRDWDVVATAPTLVGLLAKLGAPR